MKGTLFSSLIGKASREARKLSPPQAEIFGISTWKHGIFCDFDLQRHTNSLRKLYFCKHRSKKFPPAAGLVHEQLFPVPALLVILSLPHPERFRELDEMYCAKHGRRYTFDCWVALLSYPLQMLVIENPFHYATTQASSVARNFHFSSLNPSKAVSLIKFWIPWLKSLHVYMFTFENSFVVGAAKSCGDGDIGYSCTRP